MSKLQKCVYILASDDNMLVKFVDESSIFESWLPTYEVGGYLDIIEKLVPTYNRNQEITMPVFRLFERRFREFQHKAPNGLFWKIASGQRCCNCNSNDLRFINQTIKFDLDIQWLTYDELITKDL